MAKKSTDKIGRVSSASVEKGTGKDWDQWLKILNKAGARAWTHQEIVVYLKKKYKLSLWWRQGVTYGFEVATGRRLDGQSLKGDYNLTITRSLNVSAREVWKFMSSTEGLAVWLEPMSDFSLSKSESYEVDGGIFGEVRSVKAFTHARLTWQDTDWLKPTILQLGIVPKGKAKSILYINHGGFKTVAVREQMRAHWKLRMDRVRDSLASQE